MDRATLQTIGKKLDVSGADVKALKKTSQGERAFSALEKRFISLITLLSGVQGLSIGVYYAYLDQQSYPARYEPPGGWLFPICAFGSAAAVAGVAGAVYVKKKGTPNMSKQLSLVMTTVVLSIFIFVVAYFIGIVFYSWTTAIMYGVYSREEVTGNE